MIHFLEWFLFKVKQYLLVITKDHTRCTTPYYICYHRLCNCNRLFTMPPRRYRRVSDEDRERIISRYEKGEDFLDTAFGLQIPRTTAYEIIRKFIETGERRARERRGGRQASLDDEAVSSHMSDIPDHTSLTRTTNSPTSTLSPPGSR